MTGDLRQNPLGTLVALVRRGHPDRPHAHRPVADPQEPQRPEHVLVLSPFDDATERVFLILGWAAVAKVLEVAACFASCVIQH